MFGNLSRSSRVSCCFRHLDTRRRPISWDLFPPSRAVRGRDNHDTGRIAYWSSLPPLPLIYSTTRARALGSPRSHVSSGLPSLLFILLISRSFLMSTAFNNHSTESFLWHVLLLRFEVAYIHISYGGWYLTWKCKLIGVWWSSKRRPSPGKFWHLLTSNGAF